MQKPKQIAFVRDLCRGKGEEEIRDAEENFRGYIEVVMRICERMEREEAGATSYKQVDNYSGS